MGGRDEELWQAYRRWAGATDDGTVRRPCACSHQGQGRRWAVYRGEQFVAALQRLRGDAALRLARKVEPFFWADAGKVEVWLCEECAAEARLR